MLYEKNGNVKDKKYIIIVKDDVQIINPTEEMILADGWLPYTPPEPGPYEPSKFELTEEYVGEMINKRRDMTNDEALKYAVFVYQWSDFIGKKEGLETGQIVSHKENLYRVRQDINPVLENQEPSVNTAALYEVIDKTHAGTKDDPIPYNVELDPLFAGMELFEGKYYIQDKLYLCIRNSEVPLTYNLSTLVDTYVKEV